MNYKAGDFVYIKGIGAAKIDEIIDGAYWMFMADGKQGGGWKDHDIGYTIKKGQFWSEWKRFRAFN